MQEHSGNFFKTPNAIFECGLTPTEYMVYSYLVCRAGANEKCWPSVATIAKHCNVSVNTVRKAIRSLIEQGFIKRVMTKKQMRNGRWRQDNNEYYILGLPGQSEKAG